MLKILRSFRLLVLVTVLITCVDGASASANQNDEARSKLEDSATAMLALDSFHFDMTTPVGTTSYADLVELLEVHGDVQRPDSFHAEFKIGLAFVKVNLSAIGIGTDVWVTNPLEGDGGYIQVAGGEADALPPLALLNPDDLIQMALDLVQSPVIVGNEEIDGVTTTKITGTFDPQQLLEGGTPVPSDLVENVGPIAISFWIDDENHLVRLELDGPFLPGEDPDMNVVRRFDLSGFNDPVEIKPPADQEAG